MGIGLERGKGEGGGEKRMGRVMCCIVYGGCMNGKLDGRGKRRMEGGRKGEKGNTYLGEICLQTALMQ